MNITDEANAIAARKHAIDFHSRNKIKSVNELAPHALDWKALNALESEARKQVSNVLDKADATTSEKRDSIESAIDGFSDLMTEIRNEKDERMIAGDKGPRERRETSDQLAKRPVMGIGSVGNGQAFESADSAPAMALRSGETFRKWAEARNPAREDLRGMGAGQFLRAMVVQDKTELERRALSEASDSAGGYTVPDVLSATLIDKARAASVVMQAGAQTVPLTSDKNTIAKVLTDPVPAWRAEAGSLANNDGTFGAIVLTPQSLAISVDISAELMADSLNLATALPDILAAVMAVELDRVALIGTGTAPQPRGVANTTGIGTFAQNALIANYAYLSKARTGILTANRGPVTGYIMHPRDEGSFVDLHIEKTGSQPRASAFFKLPNLVCERSKCPVPAHRKRSNNITHQFHPL